jgi:anaerobic dimethyl sulfoxide reductase subunit A
METTGANRYGPKDGQLETVRERMLEKHVDEEISYVSCPQNGCFDMCLLKVHKKDGKIVAIDTDNIIHKNAGREDEYVEESEFYKGMFQHRACVRGRGWRQDVYSPSRIKYPMLRVGERGERKFKRIGWDEALDLLARKYIETREKYGPLSVYCDGLMGGSTDNLGQYFPGGALACWGVDSYEPHDFADTYCYGKSFTLENPEYDGGTEAMTLLDSKAIVLWGVDIMLNYPEFSYYLCLARDKGIPVIMIDPRLCWTAQFADQWIPIRPSTDGAAMEAICWYILTEGLQAQDFIDKWVEPTGYAKWVRYIMGEEDDTPKTPEWAEKICGIPAETLRGLARLIADGPVYNRLVWAATRMHFGENQARTGNYLNIITANVGRKGTIGTGCDFGAKYHFPQIPPIDFGFTPGEYGEHNCVEAEIWHHAINTRKRYDAGEISLEEYKAEIGCPAKEEAPNIQMIWQTINPRNMIPNYYDSNSRIEAIKSIDFIAYCAYTWATNMTWYADLVLPLPHQFFEGGGGSKFWPHGYNFCSHYSGNAGNYFIASSKVIEPPGECRSKFWILKEVAKRLGVADKYCAKMADVEWEDFDARLEDLARDAYDEWREYPEVKPLDPPTFDEFKELPYFIRPVEGDYHVWMKEQIDNDIPLDTPSGKIEFDAKFVEEKNYHTMQYRSKTYGKGTVQEIGRYQQPPYSLLAAGYQDRPLYLVTPHAFYRQHFCQDENPWFRDEYRMSVWISAADAKARGIKDNDMVLAQSDVGQCLVPAYVTSRLMPGVSCMIFGRNYEPSEIKTAIMPDGIDMAGSCNFLISDDHFGARRGILLCSGMIDIIKASGSGAGYLALREGGAL